ncbi:MAG: hypothetical protein R3C46_10415 [Hyphomonadaceae bacterium]
MDFKLRDLILMALAVAVPVVVLVLAFIPGGLGFVPYLAMHPTWQPVIFFGGAAIAAAVLFWRIYRRIKPPQRKPDKAAPHVSPAKMPKVEGSDAVRRHRDGEG